jgi:acyl-CoA synthetase
MKPFLTIHDPAKASAFYEAELWRNDTFYTLLIKAEQSGPQRPALRDGQMTLTWSELKRRVDMLADDLVSNGLGPGDRASIWMSNRLEAVVAFLACSREGVACNPSLHKSYTCAEIVGLLTTLRSSAFFMETGWGSDSAKCDIDAMLAELPFLKKVYQPGDLPMAGQASVRPFHTNPDTVAYLAFTSGTTGAPKCVMHSSNTLLANGRDLVRDWRLDGNDTILTLSPLSHHIAWVAVSQWLVAGCLLVTDDTPAKASKLDWIVANEATYVLGVPTHAMDILQEQKTRGIPRLGHVKTFYPTFSK